MRVLLLSASSGAGHVRAADALERAWRIERPDDAVVHLDILKYSSGLMRRLYTKTYFDFVSSAPELLGWVYRRTDRPWRRMRRRTAFDRLNLRRLIDVVIGQKPDLIVCTHFTPGEVVSWLKGRGRLGCPQGVVITDFDAHGMWLVPNCEMYFVAREETREYLVSQGVRRERAAATGIPIDPVYLRPKNRIAMRRKHGLEPRQPVILVSAGGFGVGSVEPMLAAILRMSSPAQVVMVCGRNEELRRKLRRTESGARRGRVRLKILGFTTDLDELMAAADLIIGKPGGLTTSESLAVGLPMVVVNPIPGQEERNSDYVLEEGAAIRVNNMPAIGWKLENLLGNPKRLAAMRRRAREIGKPRAAFEIIRHMARAAGNP